MAVAGVKRRVDGELHRELHRVVGVASRERAAPVVDFSSSRANHSAVRSGIGSGLGSIRASTPSRAKTNPARARRERWAKAAITGIAQR